MYEDAHGGYEPAGVKHPDSDTAQVSVSVNGLLQETASKTGLTTAYSYDDLGWLTGVTDPRTGTTTTAYNSLGQLASVTDPASHVTTHEYYDGTSTMAGRLKTVTDPAGRKKHMAYTGRGELWRTWGETTYPVEYTY